MLKTEKPLLKWLYDKRLYFIVFAIPFAIMYLVYAVFGVHPFGNESVLVLDLNGQYVYYYEAFRDAFYGEGSFIYNWSRNLSGEMFGIFAYYLASPFMLIPLLLPRSMMCGSVLLMELAKVGTCAVTFAFYIKNRKNAKTESIIIFSTVYALMTYVVVELMNPMWIDALIYLPLIIYGAEKLIDKGKMLPFIIPLSLMFLAHFYIGYMIGIFMAFYFVFYCFNQDGRIARKNLFENAAKYFLSAVISVGCAAIVIIPVYNSLKLGKFEFSTPDFSIVTQFDIWQFLSKLFPFTYDTVRPEGLPMVGAGTCVLLLIPLFFLNKKISMKEKASHIILSAILFILMYIKPLDIIMHGLQVPNWLPYRYSFILTFLLIIMAFRAFENLDGVSSKEVGISFFGLLVLVILLRDKNYEYLQTMQEVWAILFCLVVMYVIIYLYKKYKNPATKIVLCGMIFAEIFANSLNTIYMIDWDVNYSKFSSYQDFMADGRDVVDYVDENDDTLYRMEKTYYRTVNDAIGMGYYGLSHSSSTMNAPVLEMMKSLGIGSAGHSTKYQNSTMIIDAIFGIKYLMHKEDDTRNSPLYREYPLIYSPEDTGVADIYVYENPFALSIGYAASDAVLEVTLETRNPFNNQAKLLNTLAYGTNHSEWLDYFHPLTYSEYIPENVTPSAVSGGYTKYSVVKEGANAQLQYIFNITKEYPIYMFLQSNYQRMLNVWVNKLFNGNFFVGENYAILNLGEHEIDSQMSLILTLTKNELYLSDTGKYFNYLYPHEVDEAVNVLKKNQWNLTKHTETYLEGEITVDEGQLLFTTIPYEEGWTITVDGKEVIPTVVLDSLIAVELTAGTHTVTMKFLPNYLITAIIISVMSILLVIFIGIVQYKDGELMYRLFCSKKRRPTKAIEETNEASEENREAYKAEANEQIEEAEVSEAEDAKTDNIIKINEAENNKPEGKKENADDHEGEKAE